MHNRHVEEETLIKASDGLERHWWRTERISYGAMDRRLQSENLLEGYQAEVHRIHTDGAEPWLTDGYGLHARKHLDPSRFLRMEH